MPSPLSFSELPAMFQIADMQAGAPVSGEAAHGAVARPVGLAERMVARIAACLELGRITIVTPAGRRLEHHGARPGGHATIVIHRWRALYRLFIGGDVGFGQAYIDGDWSSPDLTALITLLAENIHALKRVLDGILPVRLLDRLRHRRNDNSRGGSRRNIAYHYDLGNEFYRLWLDESMTYSAACALPAGLSLEAAQQDKIARIIAALDIRPGDTVLEIGCGWGALALALARAGAKVTGITLSREQLAFAREQVAAAGLSGQIELRLQDYRDVSGQFDRIVSIEMLEAVGEAWWPAYFATLRQCLKPGGRAVIQAITIHEDRFESYRRDTDFIQHFVFPGGMLPTSGVISDEAGRAGLVLDGIDRFADGYAETLAEWRRRFHAAWPQVTAMGFDERFRRLWHYYLCYCEAGFRTGSTDVAIYRLGG